MTTINKLYKRPYFFDQGIYFECQQCGACCTGDPGIVYADKNEAARIAEYLGVDFSFLVDTYLYPIRAGYGIREHTDGRCFFYEHGCTVYPVRPHQCGTYPFWFENLRSLKKWKQITQTCRGIGRGDLYSKEKILKLIHSSMKAAVASCAMDSEDF